MLGKPGAPGLSLVPQSAHEPMHRAAPRRADSHRDAPAASLHGGVPEACTHYSALLSLAAPAVSNRPASADTRRCLRSVDVRECLSMVKRIL